MRPWLLALVALGGCSYVWRIDHWDYPEDAPPQPDSPPLPDAGPCPGMLVGHQGGFASGLLEYCVKSPASVASSFSIPDGFNTSNDVMCDDLPTVAGVQLCVKVASHILSTSVAADPLGTRPLVLIGLDSITITSNVNMSTHTNGNV